MNWLRKYEELEKRVTIMARQIILLQQQVVERDNEIAGLSGRMDALEDNGIPTPVHVAKADCRHHTRGMWIVEVDGERVKDAGDHRSGPTWFTRHGAEDYVAAFNNVHDANAEAA